MTDDVTRRRVPRTTITKNWNGVEDVTNTVPGHDQLAQHQLAIASDSGAVIAQTVTVYVRPILSGFYVAVGTINLSSTGTGMLLFSGIFDAVKLTSSAPFGGSLTASAQLDSLGIDFIVQGAS